MIDDKPEGAAKSTAKSAAAQAGSPKAPAPTAPPAPPSDGAPPAPPAPPSEGAPPAPPGDGEADQKPAPLRKKWEQWAKEKRPPAGELLSAKTLHRWPVGKQLTEAEFDAALTAARNLVFR